MLTNTLVWAVMIVVIRIISEYVSEMVFIDYKDLVEALFTN